MKLILFFWNILSNMPLQAKWGYLHIELDLEGIELGFRQGFC